MNEPKFTKGTWVSNQWGTIYSEELSNECHDEMAICLIHSSGFYEEEWKANARLIAQAPNMYYALKEALEGLCEYNECINVGDEEAKRNDDLIYKIEEILAKVDGES